nr:fasciclin domain-containing protein [Bacteroidota bacterium]
MKQSIRLSLAALFAAGILGMTGCDKHQERYEDPPWLGGSSIETLEDRGNYTIFLSLMEKANYTDPIAKQLFTLFVPDDDAFMDYFESAGITSVDNLTEDQAVNLFTLHVLRNPRSRYYLIYEYAWSEFQGPKAEYASLFHRKITPSTSIPYMETVRYTPGLVGQEVRIVTGDKNVALWTAEFFNDFGGAEDGSDYTYMYPESTWELNYPSNLKGMNWHNAMVIPNPEIPEELEVRTASGFIYFLDRVVPPMPSIEEYLIANQDKYGLYYDILQRFAEYIIDGIDEQRRVEYRKTYDLIFDLAEERGPSTNTAVPPQNMWSAFIPPDDVLQDYLDNSILKFYESIDSVPRVTLYYILQSQLSGSLIIKSKLQKGYFNAFGDASDLSPSDLVSGYMCSNGVVYETKRVLEPNVFKTVPGTLFFEKDYSTLLFVFNQANMLTTISNPDGDVTVFATTNDKLEEYGIRYNATNSVVEFRGPVDGKWGPMKAIDLTNFAQDQIYKGKLTDLSGEGGYVEMSSGNFIHYSNNQVAGPENQITGNLATVQEVIENDYNGLLVKVDNPIESRIVMGHILYGEFADTNLSEFSELLEDLKLFTPKYKDPVTKENIPNLKFLAAADYWTAFIPTNAAMEQARMDGIIPYTIPGSTSGKDSLTNFAMYHFIKDDVVFDDGKRSGTFETNHTYKDTIDGTTLNSKIEIMNFPENLIVK